MEQAESHVENLDKVFYGETISFALEGGNTRMAKALIEDATPEQIAAAPASLLYQASLKDDYPLMMDLIKKGARPGRYASNILQPLTYNNRNSWMAEKYLEAGMKVEPDDYGALFTCIKNDAVDCAKLILDQGMDLEQYQEWAGRQIMNTDYPALDELKEYWSELHPENVQEPTIGGMTL